MDCSNKNCKITSFKERLLTCWLCDKHEHLKCAGLNGRHFDVLTEREKYGLRWACIGCRPLEINFYTHFKESKTELAALKKVFDEAFLKLQNFEKKFNNFQFPDGSPKRKKSSVFVPGDDLIRLNSPAVAQPHNAAKSFGSDIPPSIDDKTIEIVTGNAPVEMQSSKTVPIASQFLAPAIVVNSSSTIANTIPVISTDNTNKQTLSSPRSAEPLREASVTAESNKPFVLTKPRAVIETKSVPADTFKNNLSVSADTINEKSVSADINNVILTPSDLNEKSVSADNNNEFPMPLPTDQLIVVAPRKTIFVSRLHPDTTVDNLRSYIETKIPNLPDNGIKILKFNKSQPRDISSFKIITPAKLFNLIVNRTFWPDGLLVKEFVFRERTNPVNLPVNLSVVPLSKN
ncbi:uncharacterized protein LOC131805650 [Musca domestica]|uniref:Uncharacterized protein LOC131805650 n=1 Tax=Musca domestica TaxID=7370 RepID=A0ABM3VH25_MUSDO|nr:uncharacterized protein LOC131805650 [Musca domestica]